MDNFLAFLERLRTGLLCLVAPNFVQLVLAGTKGNNVMLNIYVTA